MSETQLWYDKYRPKSLDDYVWTDINLKKLVMEWIEKKSIPSVMISGGPGRGKTSLANLIISSMKLEESDVLRLKGARDNNVETMRTKVQEFCELGGWSSLRIIFFDEADMLSRVAQEALRNIMDEFSDNVRFIFTCNYPNRIEKAVSDSRLLRIDIESLPYDDFVDRAASILIKENLEFDDDALEVIGKACETCYPDLRKTINLLQNSVRNGKISSLVPLKSTESSWEDYITDLMTKPHNVLQEVCKIREILVGLMPDEIEEIYHFLYHNGTKLFGDKQIDAIFLINAGQKAHKNALFPSMILLEVLIRLIIKMNNE
jgi:DNA polymerase III delta prime subunit